MDEAPPAFNLMVKKFTDVPSPSFTHNWEQKASRYDKGLTVITSPQCPYIPDAVTTVMDFARERGIQCKTVELKNARDVRELSPSAYGVFSIVHDGRLLAYHYLLPKDLEKLF